MNKLAEQLRQGAGHAWESLSDGWRELSARAGGALTRFLPVSGAADTSHNDHAERRPWSGWALMAADVYDDDDKVVVRIEAPGLRREDFNIEMEGNVLTVRGEKRLDSEVGTGRYRLVQTAYGSFRRDVLLPSLVRADTTLATYRDGVLRIEMVKTEGSRRRRIAVHSA
jgi:HSP20 family protein